MATMMPPWALGLWACSPSAAFVDVEDPLLRTSSEELSDCPPHPARKRSARAADVARKERAVRTIDTPCLGTAGDGRARSQAAEKRREHAASITAPETKPLKLKRSTD